MKGEIWEAVQGFEGYYEVSNLGRVRSLGRERCKHCGYRGKAASFLKQQVTARGYTYISMSKPGMGSHKVKVWAVHRLVAIHFVEGRTTARNVVNHKDAIRSNNCAINLEWVTTRENVLHMMKMGNWKKPPYHNRWLKAA